MAERVRLLRHNGRRGRAGVSLLLQEAHEEPVVGAAGENSGARGAVAAVGVMRVAVVLVPLDDLSLEVQVHEREDRGHARWLPWLSVDHAAVVPAD